MLLFVVTVVVVVVVVVAVLVVAGVVSGDGVVGSSGWCQCLQCTIEVVVVLGFVYSGLVAIVVVVMVVVVGVVSGYGVAVIVVVVMVVLGFASGDGMAGSGVVVAIVVVCIVGTFLQNMNFSVTCWQLPWPHFLNSRVFLKIKVL